jgi:hypothetical protein
MKLPRILGNGFILMLSVLLMGQAQNCGDLNQYLSKLQNLFGSGSSGGKVYISNLSFLDANSKSVFVGGNAELINTAVSGGMKDLADKEPKYVVNAPGHSLVNNDANGQKLNAIFWDPNLSRDDKVNKIIDEFMTPNSMDGLVSGQYNESADGSINLRPFVISKATKSIVTETRTFKKDEFECLDPNNPNKKILCQKAVEDIKDTVIRLLRNL